MLRCPSWKQAYTLLALTVVLCGAIATRGETTDFGIGPIFTPTFGSSASGGSASSGTSPFSISASAGPVLNLTDITALAKSATLAVANNLLDLRESGNATGTALQFDLTWAGNPPHMLFTSVKDVLTGLNITSTTANNQSNVNLSPNGSPTSQNKATFAVWRTDLTTTNGYNLGEDIELSAGSPSYSTDDFVVDVENYGSTIPHKMHLAMGVETGVHNQFFVTLDPRGLLTTDTYVGVGNFNPTHMLTVGGVTHARAGDVNKPGTIALYETADASSSPTNYSRFRLATPAGGPIGLTSEAGGTGTARDITFTTPLGPVFSIHAAALPLNVLGNASFNDAITAASGTVALGKFHQVGQNTLTATNANVTYTDVADLYVQGTPIGSTNITQTRAHAVLIDQLNATANTTNASGLTIVAPAGATNNYLFRGQSVLGTDIITMASVIPNGGAFGFLNVTGTFPATPTAQTIGGYLKLTTTGNQSFGEIGFDSQLLAGYTGSSATVALEGLNAAAGTGTDPFGNSANYAVLGSVNPTTTGTNVGVQGQAFNGNASVGVFGYATTAKNSATNIGGAFYALNTGTTPIQVGVVAALQGAQVTYASAAALFDNGTTTSPVLLARVNGVTKFQVNQNGMYTGAVQSEGTVGATLSLDVTVPNTHTITSTASTNMAITPTAGGTAGETICLIITSDATGGDVVTFASPFKPNGTMTLTASKKHTICFLSDGTNLNETSRVLAL